MTTAQPSDAIEALERLQRELWDVLRRADGERPELRWDDLRRWIAWVGWGLGERPRPDLLWLGAGSFPPSMDALTRQADRVRTVVAEQTRAGQRRLQDLAWEIERLDITVETAVLALLEKQLDAEAQDLLLESDALKAAAWGVSRTRESWEVGERTGQASTPSSSGTASRARARGGEGASSSTPDARGRVGASGGRNVVRTRRRPGPGDPDSISSRANLVGARAACRSRGADAKPRINDNGDRRRDVEARKSRPPRSDAHRGAEAARCGLIFWEGDSVTSRPRGVRWTTNPIRATPCRDEDADDKRR